MGFFSFIKDAGEKLFGKKPEIEAAVAEPSSEEKSAAANGAASEAIKGYLRSMNLPGDDLTIGFNGVDRIVSVTGLVANSETRDKIVACCGNVDGVAGVQDDMTCEEADAPECQFHVVERGDTLSAISKKVYGNANLYMKIFDANKPMLGHPDKIYPGQNLIIPAAEA